MSIIPGYENAFVSAGHNCWGILWAPASGKAMSELIVRGSSEYLNLDPFTLSRFMPKQEGKRGRKKGEMAVGEQW